jgi:hypothetical protein
MRLQWLTDGNAKNASEDETAALVSPGIRHVEELLELGRIGYVRGIEAKLAQLETDPAARPFIDAIRGHLRNFDFERYTATLEAIDRP